MILKNIKHSEVMSLKNLVAYAEGQVVSKTLIQNDSVGITLFAFAKGGNQYARIRRRRFSYGSRRRWQNYNRGRRFILQAGESIVMPAKTSHAVYGEENFKMLLVVAFPEKI